jgi:hypothetical protein
MNPSRLEGPDLLLQGSPKDIYVEVKRIRGDSSRDEALLQAGRDGRMVQYGDPVRDVRKALDDIIAKSRQGGTLSGDAGYLTRFASFRRHSGRRSTWRDRARG